MARATSLDCAAPMAHLFPVFVDIVYSDSSKHLVYRTFFPEIHPGACSETDLRRIALYLAIIAVRAVL